MSIYRTLDLLLSLVEDSKTVPLTDLRLVSYNHFKLLIERAVSELPSQLNSSKDIVAKEQHIIETAKNRAQEMLRSAHAEAQAVVKEAKTEAMNLLDQSEIIKAVNEEADKIRRKVYEETQKAYKETEQEILETERQAHEQIENILKNATKEASEIRENAYNYASFILEQMEKLTDGALGTIQGSKQRLEELHRRELAGEKLPELGSEIPLFQS